MNYCIGIDLGTSATKTILVDESGRICASDSYQYPMYEPHNGWAEQDPEDWVKAVMTTVKRVVEKARVSGNDVKSIGLSGQMHGSVCLDEDSRPLGRTILWCDQRSSAQTEEMLTRLPDREWLSITANPPLAAWTAAKFLWIREHETEKYAKTRHLLLPKDYIRYVLTGEYATDVSDATGMQLLDVRNRCWSKEVLDALEIDPSILGRVYESQEITGHLLPEMAARLGLSPDTVVVAGGSDNACAGVGTGVVNEGQAFVTLGTSAVVYSHFDRFIEVPEGGLHVCCCAVPGAWHSMGGPQSAGLSLEWFRENYCKDLEEAAKEEGISIYDLITDMVEKVPIGSEKLIYLPFLMGERTPHMDPLYRGAFLGLNTVHTQAHLMRAIMEGVVFCLADCNDLLREQGVEVRSLGVCGGGSKSRVYRRMLAALFRCDIHTMGDDGGACYGAAILAGVGCGMFPSVREACRAFIHEEETTSWSKEDARTYEPFHRIYDRMYHSLKDDFTALSRIGESKE